jgi:endonuclease IV
MIEPKAEPRARTSRIGRHLPTSGGLKKTLRLAREQGLETVQIFVSNPQGWEIAATTTVPTLTVSAVR